MHKKENYMPADVVIIGAATAKGQDYIQALLERPNDANIVAIVINKTLPQKVAEWAATYKWKIIRDGNIQELIDTTRFDTALISLPHDQHHAAVKALLDLGVHIVKEKPLAMNLQEAELYKNQNHRPIFTTVQRSTHPLFLQAKKELAEIGRPLNFTYTYTFNLPNQTSGWRSDPVKSGGGVVLDMGYHILDVVNDFFGYPEKIDAQFSYKYPELEKMRLEDAATLTFIYDGFTGNVILDRHAEKRDERFEIIGEKGRIVLTPSCYELYRDQTLSTRVELALSKTAIIQQMFDVCLGQSHDRERMQKQFDKNLGTMRMIDVIYSQKNQTK